MASIRLLQLKDTGNYCLISIFFCINVDSGLRRYVKSRTSSFCRKR